MTEKRQLSDEEKAKLDAYDPAKKFQLLDKVPTVPGFYIDKGGDLWLRTDDGQWYDNKGHSEDRQYTWILGINNLRPYKPVT